MLKLPSSRNWGELGGRGSKWKPAFSPSRPTIPNVTCLGFIRRWLLEIPSTCFLCAKWKYATNPFYEHFAVPNSSSEITAKPTSSPVIHRAVAPTLGPWRWRLLPPVGPGAVRAAKILSDISALRSFQMFFSLGQGPNARGHVSFVIRGMAETNGERNP